MRLAVISDIHGNGVGLEAVLDDLAREPLDGFVCLGDVSEGGPQPVECADRIRALGCPVVKGNCDGWLCAFEPEPELAARADIAAGAIKLLAPDRLAWINGFLPWIELDLDGVKLLCVHGTRESRVEEIPPDASEEELDRQAYGAELLAHGHTHVQSLRHTRKTTVFNPGRIGGDLDRVLRGMRHDLDGTAEYAIVTESGVELRRVRYDLAAYVRAAHENGMPHAAEVARLLA
ncbi:MAG TPA: metallophosphoesterase family protein [Gaiellaceae bacterium]